jgi:hypothetical protein
MNIRVIKVSKSRKILLIVILGLFIILTGIVVHYYFINTKPVANHNYIRLNTNGGVSQEWIFDIENEGIAIQEGLKSNSSCKNCEGGIVYLYYYFKGLKQGNTKIYFYNYDFIYGDIQESIEYDLVVNEKLEVSIKEVDKIKIFKIDNCSENINNNLYSKTLEKEINLKTSEITKNVSTLLKNNSCYSYDSITDDNELIIDFAKINACIREYYGDYKMHETDLEGYLVIKKNEESYAYYPFVNVNDCYKTPGYDESLISE